MQIEFMSLDKFPKIEDGACSEPVLVMAQEFGCAPVFAVCKGWKLKNQPVRFYLDQDFYGLPNLSELAEPVKSFAFIAHLTKPEPDRLRSAPKKSNPLQTSFFAEVSPATIGGR